MSELHAEHRYTTVAAQRIELGWQSTWEKDGTYETSNPVGSLADDSIDASADRLCVFDMFPYPSGIGLHVGHPLGYIATDVFARYHRKLGKNVLHTLGYDAFGLPAEQYAVQTGQHPRDTTESNIKNMERQLRRLGLGHDKRRQIRTMDPEYYRWTQWIFVQLFNAWYDHDARRPDGGRGKARPIAELIELFEQGRALPAPWRDKKWADLSAIEQSEVLENYRLAYADEAPVNWAPGLGTVLSNEEVTNDGRSERGNFPVFRKNLRQWKMRITAYSERLAADLDAVDWPEPVKLLQRNWIGRSVGANVTFTTSAGVDIEVFTTRPDTLAGAAYVAVAPEHAAVEQLTADAWPDGTNEAWKGSDDAARATPQDAIAEYVRAASRKSERERQIDDKVKSGVFTGSYAVNPLNGESVPVFVADYVLTGYGTGAVMAVPAHDDRDFEFATSFDLPVRQVVTPLESGEVELPFTGQGIAVNSNAKIDIDGMDSKTAGSAVIDYLAATGHGSAKVTYRLRDWLFSRQRYWGEPFPIVFDEDGVPHSLPESMLPLELPDIPHYAPTTFDPEDDSSAPTPPLDRAEGWVNVDLDLGDGKGTRRFRRETNTMPNWAGSCWYYLRYLDPHNDLELVNRDIENYWIGPKDKPVESAPTGTLDQGGVDLYVGGVEHAVLHLLYARFWHKALHDLGYVTSGEPFRKYFPQGYIQAFAYRDDRGQPVPAAEVEDHGDGTFTWEGKPVTQEFGKIGKSLKNMVSPDEMYDEYGADTFRVYEMSMGPLEASKPWDTRAVVGSQRFLQRLWRNVIDEESGDVTVVDAAPDAATDAIMHKTIAAVRTEFEALRFNTAIAKMIEFNNALTKLDEVPRECAEALVHMVAPVAPHIAEELWHRLGHDASVVYAAFPEADPAKVVDDEVTCIIQVMGKLRDKMQVPADITAEELSSKAFAREKIVGLIEGKEIRKVVVKEPKLVNIVAT